MLAAPDQQISLTDPDARAMTNRGIGTGIVGYDVQASGGVQHHLIVAHEVTNSGSDRGQLSVWASRPKRPWARRTWRLSLTGATTRARISWPARELHHALCAQDPQLKRQG